MDVQSNAKQIAVQIERTADQLPAAVEAGVQAATASLLARSIGFIKSLIYDLVIPSSKYQRTGNLLKGETSEVKPTSDGAEGRIFTDPNSPAAAYAPFRHESTQHPAPWRAMTAQTGADEAREAFTKGANNNGDWRSIARQ